MKSERGSAKAGRNIESEIIQGLEEAIRFERGEGTGATFKEAPITARRATVKPAPQFDQAGVIDLRNRLKLTQPVFAQVLNVSAETVKGWEQGRFVPQGAANRLLQLCKDKPDALLESAHLALVGTRPDRISKRGRGLKPIARKPAKR